VTNRNLVVALKSIACAVIAGQLYGLACAGMIYFAPQIIGLAWTGSPLSIWMPKLALISLPLVAVAGGLLAAYLMTNGWPRRVNE
jgi:hypothetical protein